MFRFAFLALPAAALAGCATMTQPQLASLRTADGRQVGTVELREDRAGVTMRVSVNGLPAGTHGLHVHAVGRCDPPGFTTAGPHWNPTARQHGTENAQGPHAGDLPNITISLAGSGSVQTRLEGWRVRGGERSIVDADGAAVVLHARPDDYRTDPSGNSGDRIACAVLG